MVTAHPQGRRRFRSGTVVLGGMGVLAAALAACSSEPDKRCVDRDSYNTGKGYKVVADKYCKSGSPTSGGTVKTPGKGSVNKPGKGSLKKTGPTFSKKSSDDAWYYGGTFKNGWVDGGSFTRSGSGGSGGGSSYHDDNHHSGVHRGGFGGGKGSSGG